MDYGDVGRVDRVIVDLYIRFPPDRTPPQWLADLAAETAHDSTAGSWLGFGSADVETSHAESRQDKFEGLVSEMLEPLLGAGVTAEILRESGGWLRLDLALMPASGQAGIVVPTEVISMLEQLGGQIAVKYLGPSLSL